MTSDVIEAVRGSGAGQPLDHRRAGDEARGRLDWATAEQAYGAYLAQVPDDQSIWKEYGRSLKEQGKTGEAAAAYGQAVDLLPNDPEARLSLAHALTAMGQVEDALREYAAAAACALKPNLSRGASAEPDAQSVAPPRTGIGPVADLRNAIYLEIDDLLEYLKAYKTVSGIQRVQVGIVTHAVAEMERDGCPYCLVRSGAGGSVLMRFQPGDVAALLDYIKQPVTSQARQRALIEQAEERAVPVQPREGQAYFVLGAFWGFGSNPARYSKLKAAGVRIGVYIYDLIPITHPEYCALGLVNEFKLALGDGLHAFDFILTISDYVARSVRDFIARNGLRAIPVEAVPLAHRIHDIPIHLPAEAEDQAWDGVLAPLQGRAFVLVVCTIEPRKNHAYLYWLWKSLVEEGLDPPDLVFVGRYGWRVNDFRDMLIDTGYLDGRIHVLHDLSDVDLELLYKSCLFTAFPSIAEGWGLPVGESLAHGRPIIASSTTSIPEVGGDLVDYVDPWNLTDGLAVFKRMIFDAEYRDERTRRIHDVFVPRTWSDVATDLLGHLAVLRQAPVTAYAPPRLASGELLAPGSLTHETRPPEDYARRPLRPIFAEGWYPPEHFGMWMIGGHGVLRFMADCPPGTRIVAYLQLIGAPWSDGQVATLQVAQPSRGPAATKGPRTPPKPAPSLPVRTTGKFFTTVAGEVGEDGSVAITVDVRGPDVRSHPAWNHEDARIFSVGLCGFAYAPAANLELRANLFEHLQRDT